MSNKPFKETDGFEKIVLWGILAAVVICFTLFGFVIKQECDIDRAYLWCRLHPLSLFDIIGCIMFYGGSVFISGLLPVKLYNPENSSKWNLIWFAVMALSIILIWNL